MNTEDKKENEVTEVDYFIKLKSIIQRIHDEKHWEKGLWFTHKNVDAVRAFSHCYDMNSVGQLLPDSPNDRLVYDCPWIFIPTTSPHMQCSLWQNIYKYFGIVPAVCRANCWKVAISVPTVIDLYVLYQCLNEFRNMFDVYSKCGVDVRDYTKSNYSGFIYSRLQSQGLIAYNRIYEFVIPHIPTAKIILKKGCTEFEASKPSNEWGIPSEAELEYEAMILSMFDGFAKPQTQSPWLRNRIWHTWLHRAMVLGDDTYKKVLGGDREHMLVSVGKGFASPVTYHKPIS